MALGGFALIQIPPPQSRDHRSLPSGLIQLCHFSAVSPDSRVNSGRFANRGEKIPPWRGGGRRSRKRPARLLENTMGRPTQHLEVVQ